MKVGDQLSGAVEAWKGTGPEARFLDAGGRGELPGAAALRRDDAPKGNRQSTQAEAHRGVGAGVAASVGRLRGFRLGSRLSGFCLSGFRREALQDKAGAGLEIREAQAVGRKAVPGGAPVGARQTASDSIDRSPASRDVKFPPCHLLQ
jgi:hypothetical protein